MTISLWLSILTVGLLISPIILVLCCLLLVLRALREQQGPQVVVELVLQDQLARREQLERDQLVQQIRARQAQLDSQALQAQQDQLDKPTRALRAPLERPAPWELPVQPEQLGKRLPVRLVPGGPSVRPVLRVIPGGKV
jgi:hypothetical protein